MTLVALHSTLKRFVVRRPKTLIASLARWDRKSKDVAHPHWWSMKSLRFRIYVINLNRRTQAIPGSNLDLIELMRRALYNKFASSTYVWILVEVMHISRYCEIETKSKLEYMEVQILDPPTARIRQQPGGRLNKKDGLTRYGDSHVKDKTS